MAARIWAPWVAAVVLMLLCAHCSSPGSSGPECVGIGCAADGGASACEGMDCSGHGECAVVGGNAAICVCDTGYHAEALSCASDVAGEECAGVGCSGRGACVVVRGEPDYPYCICGDGYEEEARTNCVETTTISGWPSTCEGIDCGSGSCELSEFGAPYCECETGQYSDGLSCVAGSTCDLSITALGELEGASTFFTGALGLSGDYLYRGDSTFEVIDVADPSHPSRVSSTEICHLAGGAVFLDGYAYFACKWTTDPDGIQVWSVENPEAPSFVRTVDPSVPMYSLVAVDGLLAARAKDGTLRMYEIPTPGAPTLLGETELTDCAGSGPPVKLGRTLFFHCSRGFISVDIGDPSAPAAAPPYRWIGRVSPLAARGTTLYAAMDAELMTFNVSDPTSPIPLGYVPTENGTAGSSPARIFKMRQWDRFGLFTGGGIGSLDLRIPARPTQADATVPAARFPMIDVIIRDDIAYAFDQGGGLTTHRLACE